jgi:hypothetical protein
MAASTTGDDDMGVRRAARQQGRRGDEQTVRAWGLMAAAIRVPEVNGKQCFGHA